MRAIQTECRDLRAQNAELKSELKDSLVSQICNIEKIEDSATIEKLKSRTILSLKDKLEDLNSEEKEEEAQGGEGIRCRAQASEEKEEEAPRCEA